MVELGDWDPNLFASLEDSPIKRQIRDYQDFLNNSQNLGGTLEKKLLWKLFLEKRRSSKA